MADCNDSLQELYQYLDGELTDAGRTQIAEHLHDCSPCLEAFDFEAELLAVVKNRCVDKVPDALRARIAEAISAESTGPATTAQ